MADELDFALIGDRLAGLRAQGPDSLDAYFHTLRAPVQLAGTESVVRFHVLKCEGHGAPRVNGLAALLADKVIDYAIPRTMRADADRHYLETGSSVKWKRLARKADGLFTHLKKTGEGGELLLYLLAETYLGIPQVICKMHLKTNSNVHYHGVDGVHASVDEQTGMLALWWGESKLYQSLADATTSCLNSIAPFLVPDAALGAAIERDVDLLNSYADLNDEDLVEAFKRYLDPDDPYFNRLQYRAICLLGFDIDSYPRPMSEPPVEFSQEVQQAADKWVASTRSAVVANRLDAFVMEYFIVPFPSVADFRKAFLQALGVQA